MAVWESGDPWDRDVPVRDLAVVDVVMTGSVTEFDSAPPFRVVFEVDARAERAANAFLRDLDGTFARPLTLRSYAYDMLRWLRFLAAVGVSFDEAVRTDYIDFARWMVEHGKSGGARRPRSGPSDRRLNRVTGKRGPDDRAFDPATIRHSRVVLHEWYEFLVDRGDGRPLVNPIPQSRRRDGSEGRAHAHHNPLEPFGRERRTRPTPRRRRGI